MTPETKLEIKKNVQVFKRAETYATTLYDRIVRPLMQAGIDRNDRFIRVCCVCRRWHDGESWTDRPTPVGKQTHTYCDDCYKDSILEVVAREFDRQ